MKCHAGRDLGHPLIEQDPQGLRGCGPRDAMGLQQASDLRQPAAGRKLTALDSAAEDGGSPLGRCDVRFRGVPARAGVACAARKTVSQAQQTGHNPGTGTPGRP
jgi:hypothetical protein